MAIQREFAGCLELAGFDLIERASAICDLTKILSAFWPPSNHNAWYNPIVNIFTSMTDRDRFYQPPECFRAVLRPIPGRLPHYFETASGVQSVDCPPKIVADCAGSKKIEGNCSLRYVGNHDAQATAKHAVFRGDCPFFGDVVRVLLSAEETERLEKQARDRGFNHISFS